MPEEMRHVSSELLSDYVRGELALQHEADVEQHIGSCLVCARRLREEAQLEMVLFDAHEGVRTAADEPPSRRAGWQRVAAMVANTAAAAAALVMVVTPGQPLHGGSVQALSAQSASASASAFINDALCFPSSVPDPDVDDCEDPMAVAMVTDPDDYLSPFDGTRPGRGTAFNVCLVEDLACEPG